MSQIPVPPERIRLALLAELRERLIPWAQNEGVNRLVLAELPIATPEGTSLSYHHGEPLKEDQREHSQDYLHRWPETYVHSLRSPRLCCVLQGEVDWRIGITEEMAAKLKGEAARCDYHILTMHAGTFLLIPPNVPYSDGKRDHWERPNVTQAEARVFWLQILPAGVFCHFCQSVAGAHISSFKIYIPDISLKDQVGQLLSEMQQRRTNFERIAQSTLQIILWRVERALTNQRFINTKVDEAILTTEPVETLTPVWTDATVRTACDYIQANLSQPLRLETVAAHVKLSTTHLNRRFHAELGKSVMQFTRERRIVTAKALLRDSETLIQDIARMVGYPKASQFARTFTEQEKISPSRFRIEARAGRKGY